VTTPPEPTQPAGPPGDETALGDAGKRALHAEREARRDAETARKTAEERAAAIASRLLAAEVRAAAAGKLADPGDAPRLLDLAQFTPGEDGSYDTGAITAAIDQLVTGKPYLAAGARGVFQGSGDGGPRGEPGGGGQLTRNDLRGMTPQQVNQARRAGKLDHLLKGER
jgi:hypothetical protein